MREVNLSRRPSGAGTCLSPAHAAARSRADHSSARPRSSASSPRALTGPAWQTCAAVDFRAPGGLEQSVRRAPRVVYDVVPYGSVLDLADGGAGGDGGADLGGQALD